MKAKSSYTRVAGKGSKEAIAPRSHAAKKAPKGTSGETGEAGRAKSFIVRRHMLSTRGEQ